MDYLRKKYIYDADFVETYDEVSLWSSYFGQLLFENIDFQDNLSILDLACGTGFPTFEIAQRFGKNCKVYGVDQWKEALKRAERKKTNYGVNNVELIENNAENLNIPSNSIDLVISNLGINNFDHVETALKEINRVIKINGKFIITTNVRGHFKEFYAIFNTVLKEENDVNMLKKLRNHIDHRGTVDSISKLFDDFGFEKITVKRKNIQYYYYDGTAFLNHYFITSGFMEAWKEVVSEGNPELIFNKIESKLNERSIKQGKLSMSVPIVYIEFVKKS